MVEDDILYERRGDESIAYLTVENLATSDNILSDIKSFKKIEMVRINSVYRRI